MLSFKRNAFTDPFYVYVSTLHGKKTLLSSRHL